MNNLTLILGVVFTALILTIGAFYYGNYRGYQNGYQKADLKNQTTQVAYDQEVIKLRQQNQDSINDITKDYQNKIESIRTTTEHTIASLSSSNMRLLIQVRNPSTATCSTTKSTSGQPTYEYAELSKGSSEFLIGQSIKADQWIIHLQEVIKTLIKDSDLKK